MKTLMEYALLLSAIADMGYACVELERLRSSGLTWGIAIITAAIAIEVVDFRSKRSESRHRMPHLELRPWIARLTVVASLAILFVDANVIQTATDRIHRSAFSNAVLQESAAIRAEEAAWPHEFPLDEKACLAVIAREKQLSATMQYIETSQDIQDLARQLDDTSSNPVSAWAPVNGYSAIASMKVRVSWDRHMREWAVHGGDLVIQLFWLLLPYGIGSIASCDFQNTGVRNQPKPSS